jgi:uncharacterized protein (DUF2147 family)
MIKRVSIIFVFQIFSLIVFAQIKSSAGDKIVGKWMNKAKDFEVEVYKESSGKYAAKIIWFVMYNTTKPMDAMLDKKNPNQALRNRKWLGMQTLKNLEFSSNNSWENGSIYVPKTGKTYSASCTMVGNNILKVRGYIGIKLLGETLEFTRVK